MNPCATDFTPLSIPARESSSSLASLDEDLCSSPAVATRMLASTSNTTSVDLDLRPYIAHQNRANFQALFFHHPTAHMTLPLVNLANSYQPWYNSTAVTASFCPTSSKTFPDFHLYGPANARVVGSESSTRAPITTKEKAGSSSHAPAGEVLLCADGLVGGKISRENLNQRIKSRDRPEVVPLLDVLEHPSINTSQHGFDNRFLGLQKGRSLRPSPLPPSAVASTRQGSLFEAGPSLYAGVNHLPLSLARNSACSTTPHPLLSHSGLPLLIGAQPLHFAPGLENFASLESSHAQEPASFTHHEHKQPAVQRRVLCADEFSPAQIERPASYKRGATESLRSGVSAFVNEKALQATALYNGHSSENTVKPRTATLTPSIMNLSSFTLPDLFPKDEAGPSSEEGKHLSIRGQRRSLPNISSSLQEIAYKPWDPAPSDIEPLKEPLKRTVSLDGVCRSPRKISGHRAFSAGSAAKVAHPYKNATESGSWSQSKRWVSQGTQERMNYSKMAANLRHIGADKSPFVPKNSAELTAFKAQLADLERKRLQRRVALLELKKERMMALEEEEVKLVPVLLGRTPRDKLSTVFAAQTCFRDHVLHENPQRVAWPLLAEMKDEGDKRALHGERCLPLPRLTTTIDGYKEPFAFDDVKPWKMRPVKGGSRFIRPVSQICDDEEVSCDEHLIMEELPEYLQNAIRGMEESLDL